MSFEPNSTAIRQSHSGSARPTYDGVAPACSKRRVKSQSTEAFGPITMIFSGSDWTLSTDEGRGFAGRTARQVHWSDSSDTESSETDSSSSSDTDSSATEIDEQLGHEPAVAASSESSGTRGGSAYQRFSLRKSSDTYLDPEGYNERSSRGSSTFIPGRSSRGAFVQIKNLDRKLQATKTFTTLPAEFGADAAVRGGWVIRKGGEGLARNMSPEELASKTEKKPVAKEPVPDIDHPPADADWNLPTVIYDDLELRIPRDVYQRLNATQLAALHEHCLKGYQEAMYAMERSIATAACASDEVNGFIGAVMERMDLILRAYAAVLADEGVVTHGDTLDYIEKVLGSVVEKANASKLFAYAGNVGNAYLADTVIHEGNLRERMYLLLAAKKTVFTELLADKDLVDKVNAKLASQGHGDIKIAFTPRIKEEGVQSSQMDLQGLRKVKAKHKQEAYQQTHLDTIPLTSKEIRIPYSIREIAFQRKMGGGDVTSVQHSAGGKIFRTVKRAELKKLNPYLEAAHIHRMPLIAGPSGSTDQLLTLMHAMGFDTKGELFMARAACFGWFIDTSSHTAIEVGVSGRTFDLPFTIRSDYYEDICPSCPSLVTAAKDAQEAQGQELPPYYMSEAHVREAARTLFRGIVR